MAIPQASGPGQSAFREVDTSHLQAVHSSQPVQGGIRYARIGAGFAHSHGMFEVVDLERFPGRDLKLTARCAGYRRGPELVACPVCESAPFAGEDGFDALRAAHLGGRGKTLDDLVKNAECHCFTLWSDEPFDPKKHAEAVEAYRRNAKALNDLRTAGRILEAQALVASLGGEPREPLKRIVGYVMTAAMSGRFDTR